MKTKHTLLAALFAVAGTAALAQPMPPTHPEDHGHERAERMERREVHRELRAEHRNIRRDREALKLREHEARERAHDVHEDMEHR